MQQWRGIITKKLVYATAGEPMAGLLAMPELALVGGIPSAKVSVTFLNEATGVEVPGNPDGHDYQPPVDQHTPTTGRRRQDLHPYNLGCDPGACYSATRSLQC